MDEPFLLLQNDFSLSFDLGLDSGVVVDLYFLRVFETRLFGLLQQLLFVLLLRAFVCSLHG